MSYLHADNQESQFQPAPTFSGLPYSIQKKQLQYSPIKEQRHVKCYRGLPSCLKIFHSFYNQAVKPSIRVLLNLVIIVVSLPLLLLVPVFVVCLLIFFIWMSLLSWNEPLSFTRRPIPWYRQEKTQK